MFLHFSSSLRISTFVKSVSGIFTPILTALRISSGLDKASKEFGLCEVPSMSFFCCYQNPPPPPLQHVGGFPQAEAQVFLRDQGGGGAGGPTLIISVSGDSTLYS